MELTRMARIARTELRAHGLNEWTFAWSRASKTFGLCNYTTKTIHMSARLVELNAEAECLNTLTHELAHALVGHAHGHDSVWASKHRELGGDGRARYTHESVVAVPKKWIVSCPECHAEWHLARRQRGEYKCTHCKRAGRYLYPLVWKENPAA